MAPDERNGDSVEVEPHINISLLADKSGISSGSVNWLNNFKGFKLGFSIDPEKCISLSITPIFKPSISFYSHLADQNYRGVLPSIKMGDRKDIISCFRLRRTDSVMDLLAVAMNEIPVFDKLMIRGIIREAKNFFRVSPSRLWLILKES
jgi:hypothetical protein